MKLRVRWAMGMLMLVGRLARACLLRVGACFHMCGVSLNIRARASASAGNRVGAAAGGGGEVCEADPSQVRGEGGNSMRSLCDADASQVRNPAWTIILSSHHFFGVVLRALYNNHTSYHSFDPPP